MATNVPANKMVLQLLKLLFHLLQNGFYTATELGPLLPVVLKVLDGRRDSVGLHRHEKAADRYRQWKTIKADTVLVMECKVWICHVLQLICTVRLDIRLSRLLAYYREQWDAGAWPPNYQDSVAPKGGWLQKSVGAVAQRVRRSSVAGGSYQRLE